MHVAEELVVAALVGSNRDALRVFLYRRIDDFLNGSIVTQMDHLGAGGLRDASENMNGCVVAIEQARRGYETDLVFG